MTGAAGQQLRRDIARFVAFKRTLGFKYMRAQLALESFARFAQEYGCIHGTTPLDRVMAAWVARSADRKPVTVSLDIGVLRQFCAHLRRSSTPSSVREPQWPRVPTTSEFRPHVFSVAEVKEILRRAGELRPRFRGRVYRTLVLVLYCTGLRFGEAVRLRLCDVDTRAGVMRVEQSKGRSRIVPFHRSLARELEQYLVARRAMTRTAPGDAVFVGVGAKPLRVPTASETLRRLLRKAGLKPKHGRVGSRPYDLRHTFAVHRLTQWYRERVDLQARLPWLSAYMGHDDILGTEAYLNATPELLALAGHRFHRRYVRAQVPA